MAAEPTPRGELLALLVAEDRINALAQITRH
jgi:hypothetical protein